MTENRTYSNEGASQVLGYRPAYTTPVAIREVMGWYKQQRILPATPLPPLVLALVAVAGVVRAVLYLCHGFRSSAGISRLKVTESEDKKKQ
jgi:hypothetical protein